MTPLTVELPAPARAAASDGEQVWCLAADRLLTHAKAGDRLLEGAAPARATGLGASKGVLVAVVEPAVVVWLDKATGTEVMRRPVGGQATVAGGPSGVCILDELSHRAWVVGPEGALGEPVAVADVDGVTVADGRVWWTSGSDTFLHEGQRAIELAVGPEGRGGMTACAGSVWVSVTGGLLRVGTWAGELGPLVPAPEGPVPHLACGVGPLVGTSGRKGLFVLDPSIDADARHLDVDLGGSVAFLVATRQTAWVFPPADPVAYVVAFR